MSKETEPMTKLGIKLRPSDTHNLYVYHILQKRDELNFSQLTKRKRKIRP